MYKKAIVFGLALGLMTACQNDEEVLAIEDSVVAMDIENLPSSSIAYIESNFEGEVVTDAYKVTTSDNEVSYETFLSNDVNLVFDKSSLLSGFGDIGSMVVFDFDELRSSFQGAMNGDQERQGPGMGGDSTKCGDFRGNPDVEVEEVAIEDLSSAITDYIATTYPDNEVLKAFSVTFEEITEYHVLVQEVGALIFDVDGNFLEQFKRGDRRQFKEVLDIEVSELPTAASEYLTANYPDGEVIFAQKVTNDEDVVHYRVAIAEVGIIIFDADGAFIDLHTRDGQRGRGHGRRKGGRRTRG